VVSSHARTDCQCASVTISTPHRRSGYYQNSKEERGCRFTIWDAGHYYMISVSQIDETPTLASIADALVSPAKHVKEEGRYRNARNTLGYWATVRSGNHWYMVFVSDMRLPYHKQWWLERISIALFPFTGSV
jgi:hypothetical protein